MSEKTIENDFDKAVEFIVESDFNKNLNRCLDIVKELDKKDKEIERLTKQNKALNEMYELTKKEYIRLNNIIKRLENEISGAYTNLSNNLNVNYMHEALKKDLLQILDKEKDNG